jgi:hypothetical protein
MILSFKMSSFQEQCTQCNICCGLNDKIEDCFSSSAIIEKPHESGIHLCNACGTADRIDGVPIGHHSDVLGGCDPDRIDLHNTDIRWCNACGTPDTINGSPVGHHTDNYNCIPDPRFSRQYPYQAHLYQFEIVPVISGLSDDSIPCRDCGQVRVPNPVNSDAIGCGYCDECWERR